MLTIYKRIHGPYKTRNGARSGWHYEATAIGKRGRLEETHKVGPYFLHWDVAGDGRQPWTAAGMKPAEAKAAVDDAEAVIAARASGVIVAPPSADGGTIREKSETYLAETKANKSFATW